MFDTSRILEYIVNMSFGLYIYVSTSTLVV